MNDNYTYDDMRMAYLAGFSDSGEGYNGEYCSPHVDIISELQRSFDKWLEGDL
jgi:hypothetical protein